MTEQLVYRDLIADSDEANGGNCELDLEIYRNVSPMTRQQVKKVVEGCHSIVLFFSDRVSKGSVRKLDEHDIIAIERVLVEYPYKTKKHEVWSPSLKFVHLPKRGVLISQGWYCALVTHAGLQRMMAAVRVKRFLDSLIRTKLVAPGLDRLRAYSIQLMCAMYVAKFGVEYVLDRGGRDPLVLENRRYKEIVGELMKDIAYPVSFRHDANRLYLKVRELLRLDAQIHPKLYDSYMKHLTTAPNLFNTDLAMWNDEMLFVRGTWNTYFGRR